MKGDILLQNIVNIFIISIVLNAAVMAVFSMSSVRKLVNNKPVEAARDVIVLLLSLFICYKVDVLRIFRGTGIKLPYIFDVIISGLVLTSLINFIRRLLSSMRQD